MSLWVIESRKCEWPTFKKTKWEPVRFEWDVVLKSKKVSKWTPVISTDTEDKEVTVFLRREDAREVLRLIMTNRTNWNDYNYRIVKYTKG